MKRATYECEPVPDPVRAARAEKAAKNGRKRRRKVHEMKRYQALSDHFRSRFGHRIQKIPLDAGFSCPNRDGVISSRGCVFCNPKGSGSGLLEQGLGLAEQWEHWAGRYRKKYGDKVRFLAYLQSFSNTYGPAERVANTLAQLRGLDGLAGLAMGTRPDCLDEEKLRMIADFEAEEIWLELGLQSSCDETLSRINRGHTFADFQRAVALAHAVGKGCIQICAHLVAGLPGEGEEDFLRSVDALGTLPVHGVKFHNLYVCRDTGMEELWRAGTYQPLQRADYVNMVVKAIARLAPHVVVHRLTGDAAPGELLAPEWAADKRGVLADIAALLETTGTVQGADYPSF